MAHSRARLTPFMRRLLVERIETLGWSPAEVATAMGVSRATVYKWLQRFRDEGEADLEDRTCRPHTCPHALARSIEQKILRVRARTKVRAPSHRLRARPAPPTVYAVLRRHGVSRLDRIDRPTGAAVRYTRERPGELLHVDVKKLGRIPPGGGWRAHGRENRRKSRVEKQRRLGYDYLHVAVDDHSRVAYVEVHPDDRAATCAEFLLNAASSFAARGVHIERVMTDRAFSYTESRPFAVALEIIGASHQPTRGYRPQANGKAERFIKTLLDEWAYDRAYRSNEERLRRLPKVVRSYNHRRPHTSLGGRTPMDVLVNNVAGNHT